MKTYPMSKRHNLVKRKDFARLPGPEFSASTFIQALPDIHAGKQLKRIIELIVTARRADRPVILGMGAHVIKCGLAPWLIRMLETRALTGLALNGAGSIHDFELAFFGETSEDVGKELAAGRFGFVEETGAWMGEAMKSGIEAGLGIGAALGKYIDERPDRFPHRDISLLWHCWKHQIPCTVHVAIGTDFIHLHPAVEGAVVGEGSFRDFFTFCGQVEALERGVYWNLGSAVVLPEVFLKAVSRAHNLGNHLEGMTTFDMDMLTQYRSTTNVVKRPSLGVGQGFHLTGHHEIMVPLLAAAILEELAR